MKKLKLNESQLADLLDCLYERFTSCHGANTGQLAKHKFYVTDRMSCAKAAKLNFMYPATTQDGQRVQMHNSIYAKAVSTLVHRGLVQWVPDEALAFSLTLSGYEKAHARQSLVTPTPLQRFLRTLNEYNGLISVLAIIAAVVTTWYFSSPSVPK